MTILKFEIDTDEIFHGDEYDTVTFNDLVRDGLRAEITKAVTAKVSAKPVDDVAEKIKQSVDAAVENKLTNLINEEIAMTDRWGKPVFIGTVEDYIKKQIDEKTLQPVNNDGRPLTGSCTSATKTWVEWAVEKEIKDHLSTITDVARKTAQEYCKETLKKELEKFTSRTLSGEIMKRLEAVGIK